MKLPLIASALLVSTSAYAQISYGGASSSSASITVGTVTPATITAPASGSAPSGATQFSYHTTTVPACSATQPMQLTAGLASGSTEFVLLNRAGSTCTIYPPSGGTIESNAANVPVTIASGTDVTFRSTSATAWNQ